MKPQIVMDAPQGLHNLNMDASLKRLEKGRAYKDLSTICIVPTRGVIPAKVVQYWFNLMTPMNQKFFRIFMIGMEVGDAYNNAVELILNHPQLKGFKYLLTLEEDNIPPPDALLKLYEDMEKYDVVGALYWTKGEAGQPMIYGDPSAIPLNFLPQMPRLDTLQECCGLGMGFTLFRTSIFRDQGIPRPFFRTIQEYIPGQGTKGYTQDLYFFENIHRLGYKVACDTRVKVGHYDLENDRIW